MKTLYLALLLILTTSNLMAEETTSKNLSLTFGVYQSDKATVMYRKFSPLIKYLEETIANDLGLDVEVELRIFKGYEEANDALVNGNVDFVRFGPASYIIAKTRNPSLQLLAMEEKKGKTVFQGLIVVKSDSDIRQLTDLKGKKFAFGNSKSTIGRYLSQAELVKENVRSEDLLSYEYLGRHDKVFRAVELGDFDAGALKSSTVKRLNKENQLRVIHAFDNITKPWIAKSGLKQAVVDSIRRQLIELKDKKVLKIFKASGFQEATDKNYQFVREGMTLSEKF